MEKMKMHSPNLAQENITRIRELFPTCITETLDEKGKLKLAVDFDLLRQELSEIIVEGSQERYHLNWPGKREALLNANAPIAKTLRPCRDESVNFDTTKNLFIEGDNLDALKLLQETYLGKVKMIYIDPPYNTGKDFIYKDDFAEISEAFLKKSNQKDECANRLVAITESNGRFHSDWLSMIYPRLKLARNLLRDDGVIFISIDDNETENLKKVCVEVFGEDNFVAQFVWNTEGHTDNQFDVKVNHEYVLLFAKNAQLASLGHIIDPNTRLESNLWKGYAENSVTKNGPGNPPSQIDLPKGFPCLTKDLRLSSNQPKKEFFEEAKTQGYITRELTEKYDVTYPIRLDNVDVEGNQLISKCRVYSGWANANKLKMFIQNNFKPVDDNGDKLSFYLTDKGVIYYLRKREKARNIVSVLRNLGTTEKMRSELEQLGIPFQYPKPRELLRYLIQIGAETEGIVLDFFAGSGTTADALILQNSIDGVNRRFIMVQIPESCNAKSLAFKAYYTNIAEISKDRIRFAGKKILEGDCHKNWNKDIGFRIFKIDSSNMADVYYTPDATKKNELPLLLSNIKPDRTVEDQLFQVLQDWGVDLSLPIRKESIRGKTIFFVDEDALVACFDKDISDELIMELAKFKPLKAVFRDDGFVSDAVKINVEQIFKQLSPRTEVKSI